MSEDCIFCKIVKGEIPCTKTFESENFIGFLDINPFTKGHTLIIPKKHFRNFLSLPEKLYSEAMSSIRTVSEELMLEQDVCGFNLIQSNESVAQQEVFHLHFHIVPRRTKDNKDFKFG